MARGPRHALQLAKHLVDGGAPDVPELAQRAVTGLAQQIGSLEMKLAPREKEILARAIMPFAIPLAKQPATRTAKGRRKMGSSENAPGSDG
jgi:hypothetical protein